MKERRKTSEKIRWTGNVGCRNSYLQYSSVSKTFPRISLQFWTHSLQCMSNCNLWMQNHTQKNLHMLKQMISSIGYPLRITQKFGSRTCSEKVGGGIFFKKHVKLYFWSFIGDFFRFWRFLIGWFSYTIQSEASKIKTSLLRKNIPHCWFKLNVGITDDTCYQFCPQVQAFSLDFMSLRRKISF